MDERKDPMKYRMKFLMRLLEFVSGDDLSLIVLKGHLAIDEELVSLIARHLNYPDALDDAHLTFFHRVYLAKAMYYRSENMWIWTSLIKFDLRVRVWVFFEAVYD
jgi:hypothetical protein